LIEYSSTNNNQQILILGDFNSQIGSRNMEENRYVGPYNFGRRNSQGERFLKFCRENNFKIINTFFKKCPNLRWTWISPNLDFKSQIDYILVPTNCNKVIDFNVLSKFNFHSDHRLITCKLKITKNRKFKTSNYQSLKNINWQEYEKDLSAIFSQSKNHINNNNIEENYSNIVTSIQKALNNQKNKAEKPNSNFPKEIHNLYNKRNKLKQLKIKTNKDKVELNVISKIIKNKIRVHINNQKNKIIQNILETTKSTKKN